MGVIAIIDDRADVRQTLARAIQVEVPDWSVIDAAPLAKLDAYPHWLVTEHVSVLVLDELLRERANDAGQFATYDGHDVAAFLRERKISVPVYAVTAFSKTDEIAQSRQHFDGVHDRDEFTRSAEKLVPTFVRAGQRFLDENERELAEFTELSSKAASGSTTDEDATRLKALQGKLDLAVSTSPLEQGRLDALKALERKLDDLDELRQRVESLLGTPTK